ncbi:MAG: homoserine O-acetyltransferase MetX [Acidimicrobiia bacterium]
MRHSVTLDGAFPLEKGGTLHDITVEVRTWGKHRPNATLVCHALTGDANADQWWQGLFGPGRTLDQTEKFIVAMNVLGSCNGTTGPTSTDETGEQYGPTFPSVTIRDIVAVQRAVLDQLGVETLDLVIGGSMGGMQVIEWAVMYPDRVKAIAPIAVGAAQSPWAVGLSEAQRHAIVTDPAYESGWYSQDAPPAGGLATARMIAMCSYRSAASFDSRFGRSETSDGFAVQSYLRHHGTKLVSRFDANSYLTLIAAMDSHDVGRGRGPAEAILRHVRARTLVIGVATDVLYPVSEVRRLAQAIPGARYAALDSPHGHDSFLIDVDAINDLVVGFLADVPVAPALTSTTSARGASWA